MEMLAQWLLLAAAVGIGWLLGRFGLAGIGARKETGYSLQIPAGVRFTFENQSDEAIDKYVRGLDVEKETLPMHLSIATHFRKKGEVDRAIVIHQHLLASPRLDSDSRERATLELARDYMSAGLLDRAESLLKQLSRSRTWGERSLHFLLDVYQDEKEWEKARETALGLDYKRDRNIQKRLAHYCCEQADQLLQKGDHARARQLLREALGYDRSCVRVTFMVARIHLRNGDYNDALFVLHKIEGQDVRYLPEAIPWLVECYRELGQEAKLQQYLATLLERAPSASSLIAYADSLRQTEGNRSALAFIAEQLNRRPSVKGLDYLLQLQIANASPDDCKRLEAIRRVTGRLLESKPLYLCENCGYSGRTLLWFCPSCKNWETIKPVQGIEGE